MTRTRPRPFLLLAACLTASLPLAAQPNDLKGDYDTKTGLITPRLSPESMSMSSRRKRSRAKKCTALTGPKAQFPVMVLPTSGTLGGRTLADGAIRGMKTLREAAVEAGANAILGLRSGPFLTRNGNPRIFCTVRWRTASDAGPRP